MNESIILLLLGSAGVLFHCLIKMKSLKDSAISANLNFHWWKTYVKKDGIAITTSFLSVLIWYGIFGEVGNKYPYVLDFKRTIFVFAGIAGSVIIQFAADAFTNSAKKQIQKVVDIKTNISDMAANITPTDTIEKVIEKGNELTGKDVTNAPPAPKEVEVTKQEAKEPAVKP